MKYIQIHTTYTLTHIVLLSNHKTIIHIKRAKKNMERGWSLLTFILILGLTFPISLHNVAPLCLQATFHLPPCLFSDKESKESLWSQPSLLSSATEMPTVRTRLPVAGGKKRAPNQKFLEGREGPAVSEPQLPALCPAGPLNWPQGSYTSAHSYLPLLSTEGLLNRGMSLFLQRSSLSRGEFRQICNELWHEKEAQWNKHTLKCYGRKGEYKRARKERMRKQTTATFWKLGHKWRTRLISNWLKRSEQAVSSTDRPRSSLILLAESLKKWAIDSTTSASVRWKRSLIKVYPRSSGIHKSSFHRQQELEVCLFSRLEEIETPWGRQAQPEEEGRVLNTGGRSEHLHPKCWDLQPSPLLGFHKCGHQS